MAIPASHQIRISPCRENFRASSLHAALAAHQTGQLLDAFERERRLAERLHRDAHQLHRVVVGGDTIRRNRAAALAAVDYRPFAALSDPDRDRLHYSAAIALAVAGFDVDVKARKAVRTVISVVASRAVRRDEPPADFTGEALFAGVSFVVSFFK